MGSPRPSARCGTAPLPRSNSAAHALRPLPAVNKAVAKEAAVVAAHAEWLVEASSDVAQNPELTELSDAYSERFGRTTPHALFAVAKDGVCVGVVAVACAPPCSVPLCALIPA